MIIDAKEFKTKTFIECDVCIMGAGPAGITLALELAKNRNLDIVLIEGGGKTYDPAGQNLYKGSTSFQFYPRHEISRLRFLGGSTNHWEGSCRPLDAIDFEKRDWVSNSGWPITMQDLDPYYEIAHQYCQLGEYDYSIDFWERESDLKRLFEESGKLITVANQHSPPTRFGYEYHDRLESTDNIRVLINSNVVNIVESRPVSTIKMIEFKVIDGVSGEVRADEFVLSTGGLENSRILLSSNSVSTEGIGNETDVLGRYYMDHPGVKAAAVVPNNLWPLSTKISSRAANRLIHWTYELDNGYIRDNELVNARLTLIPKTQFEMSEGVESLHQIKKAFAKDLEIDSYFDHIGNIIWDIDLVAEGLTRNTFVSGLFDGGSDPGGYIVNAMMEQTPEATNRIRLSDERDALGIKRLHLEWRVSEQDKANLESVIDAFAVSLTKSRYCRVRSLLGQEDETERRYEEIMDYGYHHMGGTRMSNSSQTGVVDQNLKVFERKNLYVVGSSVFPTGGYVPPTLTIVALAIRLADHLKTRLN